MDATYEDQDRSGKDRSPDTAKSPEGKLIDRMTLCLPCLAEADVGDVDGEPGEDGAQTRQGQ